VRQIRGSHIVMQLLHEGGIFGCTHPELRGEDAPALSWDGGGKCAEAFQELGVFGILF